MTHHWSRQVGIGIIQGISCCHLNICWLAIFFQVLTGTDVAMSTNQIELLPSATNCSMDNDNWQFKMAIWRPLLQSGADISVSLPELQCQNCLNKVDLLFSWSNHTYQLHRASVIKENIPESIKNRTNKTQYVRISLKCTTQSQNLFATLSISNSHLTQTLNVYRDQLDAEALQCQPIIAFNTNCRTFSHANGTRSVLDKAEIAVCNMFRPNITANFEATTRSVALQHDWLEKSGQWTAGTHCQLISLKGDLLTHYLSQQTSMEHNSLELVGEVKFKVQNFRAIDQQSAKMCKHHTSFGSKLRVYLAPPKGQQGKHEAATLFFAICSVLAIMAAVAVTIALTIVRLGHSQTWRFLLLTMDPGCANLVPDLRHKLIKDHPALAAELSCRVLQRRNSEGKDRGNSKLKSHRYGVIFVLTTAESVLASNGGTHELQAWRQEKMTYFLVVMCTETATNAAGIWARLQTVLGPQENLQCRRWATVDRAETCLALLQSEIAQRKRLLAREAHNGRGDVEVQAELLR